jgi:nucleoside-diphosphate-sugar epimerase
MKILVTGASGFIGSGLVEALSKQGHDVCALMRRSASAEYLKGVSFTRLAGDLLEPEALKRACEGVDVVFHLAGATAAKNREEFFKLNAEGTRNLADAAVAAGTVKRFIYVSSLAASGPSGSLCPRTEVDLDLPVSAYGESKLRGELYLDELKDQLPFVVVRPPMVYGPRDKNVFLLFKAISKQWMPVMPSRTPTGHKYYSTIHVHDLIQALLLFLTADESHFHSSQKTGERFFVSDGHIYTAERMFSLMAQAFNSKPFRLPIPFTALNLVARVGSIAGILTQKNMPINEDKLNELIPDYWICSNEKFAQSLNFKPEYTMETGIPQTAAWYKMNNWL